jgi:hypothetical protein
MVEKQKVMRKVTKRAAAPARSEVSPQGRRFDDTQKQHALVLVASGMSRVEVAATIGTTTESLRRWGEGGHDGGHDAGAPDRQEGVGAAGRAGVAPCG